MNYLVGIVGGIGSGKSTVAERLKALGADVLDADKENAVLLQDPAYIAEVEKLAPTCVRQGKVDKNALRAWMLESDDHADALTRLSHPLLRSRILDKVQDTGLNFVELSAYSPEFLDLDELWLVTAPVEVRIERVQRRSGWDVEQIEAVMARQNETLLALEPTLVLDNSAGWEALYRMVDKAYDGAVERFLKKGRK